MTVTKDQADEARAVIDAYREEAFKHLTTAAKVALRPAPEDHPQAHSLLILGELRGMFRPLVTALNTVAVYEEGRRQVDEMKERIRNGADPSGTP